MFGVQETRPEERDQGAAQQGRRTTVCRWKVNFEEYLSLTDVLSVEQVELDDSRLIINSYL